jgi:hypothetical protein
MSAVLSRDRHQVRSNRIVARPFQPRRRKRARRAGLVLPCFTGMGMALASVASLYLVNSSVTLAWSLSTLFRAARSASNSCRSFNVSSVTSPAMTVAAAGGDAPAGVGGPRETPGGVALGTALGSVLWPLGFAPAPPEDSAGSGDNSIFSRTGKLFAFRVPHSAHEHKRTLRCSLDGATGDGK